MRDTVCLLPGNMAGEGDRGPVRGGFTKNEEIFGSCVYLNANVYDIEYNTYNTYTHSNS